jgi:hypothetical protein
MSCDLVLNIDNSVTVKLILTNPETDPIYVNDATVTAEILDMDDTEIRTSFALPYVVASDGVYRETITPVAGLTKGVMYKVVLEATGSDGIIGKWTKKIKATIAS